MAPASFVSAGSEIIMVADIPRWEGPSTTLGAQARSTLDGFVRWTPQGIAWLQTPRSYDALKTLDQHNLAAIVDYPCTDKQ